ncbi:hypothetical protein D6783_02835 [Candidatus Woesearchaeota archaeon]|nr:MAG: hypothetical protein D6783_02835 [Candidatus Woesearchaeota archaeon]
MSKKKTKKSKASKASNEDVAPAEEEGQGVPEDVAPSEAETVNEEEGQGVPEDVAPAEEEGQGVPEDVAPDEAETVEEVVTQHKYVSDESSRLRVVAYADPETGEKKHFKITDDEGNELALDFSGGKGVRLTADVLLAVVSHYLGGFSAKFKADSRLGPVIGSITGAMQSLSALKDKLTKKE